MQAALEFMERVRNDEALQREIQALRGPQALERLVLIAQTAGFTFSEEEYRAAVVHEAEGELDDSALDALAREAGFGPPQDDE